jgi:hypothetical protein
MPYLGQPENSPCILPPGTAVNFFIEDMQAAQLKRFVGIHRSPCIIGRSALYPMVDSPGKKGPQLPAQFNYGVERMAIYTQLTQDEELLVELSMAQRGNRIGLPIIRPQDADQALLAAALDEPGYNELSFRVGSALSDGGRPFWLFGENTISKTVEALDFTSEAAKQLLVAVRFAVRSDITSE